VGVRTYKLSASPKSESERERNFVGIDLAGLRRAGVDSIVVGTDRMGLEAVKGWAAAPLRAGSIRTLQASTDSVRRNLREHPYKWRDILALQGMFLSNLGGYDDVAVVLAVRTERGRPLLRPGDRVALTIRDGNRSASYPFTIERGNGPLSLVLGTLLVLGFLWASTS